jgi:hypothetical protein
LDDWRVSLVLRLLCFSYYFWEHSISYFCIVHIWYFRPLLRIFGQPPSWRAALHSHCGAAAFRMPCGGVLSIARVPFFRILILNFIFLSTNISFLFCIKALCFNFRKCWQAYWDAPLYPWTFGKCSSFSWQQVLPGKSWLHGLMPCNQLCASRSVWSCIVDPDPVRY